MISSPSKSALNATHNSGGNSNVSSSLMFCPVSANDVPFMSYSAIPIPLLLSHAVHAALIPSPACSENEYHVSVVESRQTWNALSMKGSG